MLFAILTIASSLQVHAQKTDCLSCHSLAGASGKRDFSKYYLHPKDGHPIARTLHFNHPVGMKYPASSNANPHFNQPNVWGTEIIFFDRNGNGLPDGDEIQLFAAVDEAGSEIGGFAVECASCHREHGNDPVSVNTHDTVYLRIDNKRSELCVVCHKK